jgi:hypothetical protein
MHTRHPRRLTRLAIASLVLGTSSVAAADIVFVNAAQGLPTIVQTGATWGLAYKSLATAFANASPGDEIWVAGGVYKPTTTTSQTVSFTPPDGVRVLGGFTVGDALESDRDPIGNPTVLSGDIGAAGASDNSLHILRANGVVGTEIDGFVFSAGNAESSGLDGTGGAILLEGGIGASDVVIRGCRFVSNQALAAGGAIAVRTDGVTIVGCEFRNNSASNGGAIEIQQGAANIVSCRFLNNDAALGGAAMFAEPGGSVIQNCVFSGNSANGGGAVTSNLGNLVIETSTFVNNTASNSGGAILHGAPAITQVRNSIVWGNTANGVPNQIAASGINFSKFSCDIQGNANDAQGNFSSDPLFVNALGIDGVAGTDDDDLRLRVASPCIDRGNSELLFDDIGDVDGDGSFGESLPNDIDGLSRFRDDLVDDLGLGSPSHLDLGAHEFKRAGTTLCVNGGAAAGGDGTTWAKALNSLPAAITITNTQPLEAPVRIWVAKGTYKPTTTTDRNASFKLTTAVGVYGGFAGGEASLLDRFPQVNPTNLSGDIGVVGATSDNSFHVVEIVTQPSKTTILDGFQISGGNASGGSAPVNGGGIRVTGGAGGLGTALIRACRITQNLGVTGGGIGSSGTTQTNIQNCYIAGNVATAGGGGIAATTSSATVTVSNCTVVGNTANVGGGAIAQGNGSLIAHNSIFYFNEATTSSGEAEQVTKVSGLSFTASHCCIQCLGVGSTISAEGTCIGDKPAFNSVPGSDGAFGTSDDVILLRSFSPCIDSGNNASLPSDVDDADEDGLVNEPIPFDISLQGLRSVDDTSVPNTGRNTVDMGATERSSSSFGAAPNPADIDGDGVVGQVDLALVLGAFGSTGPTGDVNADCTVDAADIAVVLGAWTG